LLNINYEIKKFNFIHLILYMEDKKRIFN